MCQLCDIQNAVEYNPFTEEELDGFVADVWKGINTTSQLSRLMYYKTADKLSEGLRLGLAVSAAGVPEESVKYRLAKDLQQNIFRFSAAKTYQQTLQLNKLLVGENGETRTYGQFLKEAKKELGKFNGYHLAAEYQRTVAGSQNALLWDKIQETKHLLPNLRYQTVGDQRVRPTHAALDNIVRPVDDSFWLSYMPPNGWNCRCTVEQLQEEDAPLTDMTGFEKPKDVPDEFLMNTGKQRLIFNDKHPYYEVHPRDVGLAMNNFNLPIPQTPTPAVVGPSNKKITPISGEASFDNVKTPKEFAKTVDQLFFEQYGTNVKTSVTGSGLSMDQMKAAGKQLQALTKEYKLSEPSLGKITLTQLKFKSTSVNYGAVMPTYEGHAKYANFGDKFDSRRSLKGFEKTGAKLFQKSIVDDKNISISTLTHEFAHLITTTQQRFTTKNPIVEAFWSEIQDLNKLYKHEVQSLIMRNTSAPGVLEELKQIYLGDYARKNYDEFFAEGFTQYKLNSNPSKYAKLIGKIVDKYFKK
jgi:SPP1 gp7 family putative phage head morphogenesis protein